MERRYFVIKYKTSQENGGVRITRKENLENKYKSQEEDLQNIKYLENNGENNLKNITRKDLIIK